MLSKKKVAIIGLGNIGKAVANDLVRGSRSFIIAGRNEAPLRELAQELGLAVEVAPSIREAIQRADLILPTIPYGSIAPLLKEYAAELQGKIVIDPSNAVGVTASGQLEKTIPADQSAGENIAAALPAGVRLVKAFGTLSTQSLQEAAHATPQRVLFYATNDASTHADIEELISDAGFTPYFLGGLEQSQRMEVFGALHEFGGLGKAVTLEEAKAAL